MQDDPERWSTYHRQTREHPPRPLLVRTAGLLKRAGKALDLGCGAGNDTRYLLDRGFDVTAMDADRAAIDAIAALRHPNLRAVCSTFASFDFDEDGYDLISAQLALPFTPPETFADVFARLRAALRPGAYFTGHLFGPEDAWNTPGSGMTFLTRSEVEASLVGLRIIELGEMRGPTRVASGGLVDAHAFGIIARRPHEDEGR